MGEPKGLYGKYNVTKAGGEPVEGFVFVLRMKDRHARAALNAYAESVQHENTGLAQDIKDALRDYARNATNAPAAAQPVTAAAGGEEPTVDTLLRSAFNKNEESWYWAQHNQNTNAFQCQSQAVDIVISAVKAMHKGGK